MRTLLVVFLFTATIFAGCLDSDADTPAEAVGGDLARLRETLVVPEGAQLVDTATSLILSFTNVTFPFEQEFELPDGATMVRLSAENLEGSTVSVRMSNAETGRRRCNQQPVVGFFQTHTGERTCGSLAAIDPPGTTWNAYATASVSEPGDLPGTSRSRGALGNASIEFSTAPVDGIAAELDLSQLSHAVYDLNPTSGMYVESFDGTPLWVEVTLPQGEGPWPTIIAASPYNGQSGRLSEGEGTSGTPAMWTYWTQDWAKRGYAAVNVDVRGFGKSEGCVGVWSLDEQLDQKFIVEWATQQDWSNGHTGFYGQSYVGTTPVAAASHAAEGLDAIIAVAPVINAYEDWHYGGVPNGESSGSPAAYQVLTDLLGVPYAEENPTDLVGILQYASQGICDPSLVPRANDPRAIYNEFYEERDFKLRVKDVTTAVMYTEGFEDANVKSAMIPGWFNELDSDKLGIFGHWLHQHPARLDIEVLMLGWMDQYVKGKDIGFDRLPDALITVENDLHRVADAWPPEGNETALYTDFTSGELTADAGAGTASIDLNPGGGILYSQGTTAGPVGQDSVTLTYMVSEDLPFIAPHLHLSGTLSGENGFVQADVYQDRPDGTSRLLTTGRINLALRDGYDSYEPLTPGMSFDADLPFRPTEHMVEAGSTLRLIIGDVPAPVVGAAQPQPAILELDGAGTYLRLPVVELDAYHPIPLTAIP